jgi:hypothetical protein
MNPSTDHDHQALPENWGYDLLMYGNEHIIRGSDTGTLVAFGAIAFQELRGGKHLAHQQFGCGILLFSVLLCALVHFAVGGASISRAKSIIRGSTVKESTSNRIFRKANQLLTWVFASLQFISVVVGIVLVLKETPPEFLQRYVLSLF